MNVLIAVTLLYSAITISNTFAKILNPVLQSRIVGGRNAAKGDFPYQANILRHFDGQKDAICSGSLISNEWVLTSAFCVKSVSFVNIYFGDLRLFSGVIIYDVKPNNIISHKEYNPRTRENDIAVIRIPFTQYSNYIHNIKLPSIMDQDDYTGMMANVTGWGLTGTGRPSPILQWASFPIGNNEQYCKQLVPIFKDTQLCIATTKLKSPCYGDFGAPLVYESSYGLIQIGIATFSISRTCKDGFPFGFTRVNSYLRWINRKTGIPIQGISSFNQMENEIEKYNDNDSTFIEKLRELLMNLIYIF